MNNKPLILIIDDEESILHILKVSLEDEGFRIKTLTSTKGALTVIGNLIPDLVLLDVSMPGINGIIFLEQIKKEYPQIVVMMISGFGNIPIALDSIKKGAKDFLEKPLNLDELFAKIDFLKRGCINSFDVQNNIKNKDYRSCGIVGESALFKELIKHVNNLIHINLPILIYGFAGTGKKLFGKYINFLLEKSLDSLIFIHPKSEENYYSILKQENKTIFINHVELLNKHQQEQLLFVIEQLEIENKNIKLILSSSPTLFSCVQNKTFDSILFSKINVIPIEIPPLSKRRCDIPILIEEFISLENKKQKKQISFTTNIIRYLRNRDWKYNIKQLKTFISYIVSSAKENCIIISSIDELDTFFNENEIPFMEEQEYLYFNNFDEAMKIFQHRYLSYMLKKSNYDLDQVSSRMGLHPKQLHNKILELNIQVVR